MLQRGIRTAEAHGHPDIGGGKSGGIIHSVADHGDMVAFGLKFPDDIGFLAGEQSGMHFLYSC